MNRFFTFVFGVFLMMACQASAQDFESVNDAVKHMGVGWNLGNTLDANGNGVHQGIDSETYWGQPTTKPELMMMMKEAGFGAIRIPVTWYNHMDANGKVDAAWMQRVHQVVDYVLNTGMYCLLNVHHDTGDGSTHWLHASMNTYNDTKDKFEYLWQQIAEEFKEYGEKLLFEGYNEMLDEYNSWCFASFAAPGRYDAESSADSYNAINSYAQSFVNAVRATGGNNSQRNLVVNTYAAANGYGNWNSHLKDPLTEMKYPVDPAGTGHIAFQVHFYPSVENMTNTKNEVNGMIALLKTHLVSKGAPVIIGEWGTANSNGIIDYDVRRDNVLEYARYFVQQTKKEGIGTFEWMGITDGTARSIPVFSQPDFAEAILKGWYGDSYQPVLPTRDDLGPSVYDVTYTALWAELNLVSNPIPTDSYSHIELTLAEAPKAGVLQLKVYKNDNEAVIQKITTASSTMTLDATTMGTIIQRITLQNCVSAHTQIRVTDVVLVMTDGTKRKMVPSQFWGCSVSESFLSAITPISIHRPTNGQYYDLQGRAVRQPTKGIYLLNGHKYAVK